MTTGAQLTLSMWILDLDNNVITLTFFDMAPANNGTFIDCTAILIGPVAGNISMAIQLPSSVTQLPLNERTVTCDLGEEFRSILNADPTLGTNVSNTFLYYGSTEEISEPGNETVLVNSTNATFSETDGFQATRVVLDNNPPVITHFDLDMNIGLLTINFSQPVNVSTWNFTDLYYPDNNTIDSTVAFLTGNNFMNSDTCSITGRCVTVLLSEADRNSLNLLLSTSFPIMFNYTSALVEDFGGNRIVTSSSYGLTVTNDATRPSLLSCDLDLLSDQLTLEANEAIDFNSFMFSGITIHNNDTIAISSVTYTLTGGMLLTTSGSTIVVSLLSLDAENIRSLNFTESSTYLSLQSSAFVDLSGNSVGSIPPEPARPCSFLLLG